MRLDLCRLLFSFSAMFFFHFSNLNSQCVLERVSQFKIEETDSVLIGVIGSRIKFKDGRIIIRDRTQPYLFLIDPRSGKIVKQIKFEFGQGPGEVLKIGGLEIAGNRIYLQDDVNRRFSVFDTSGKFLKSFMYNSKDFLIDCFDMQYYRGKIYLDIVEIDKMEELKQCKSKAIGVLDTNFNMLMAFGEKDEIYCKYRIYNSSVHFTLDSLGNIYYSNPATYKIYKYSSDGKKIKVFGEKGRFSQISENMPAFLPREKIDKIASKYSWTHDVIYHRSGYILHQYVELPKKFFITRDLVDRFHFLKIYDTDGNLICQDVRLPGMLVCVDDKGLIYILESDEPGNRKIGVYKLNLGRKK